jgi:tRNA A37 threonylcarbamoyladenosine dehydratase
MKELNTGPSPETLSRFTGTIRLYGLKAFDSFQAAHVLVIGIGGVGSWTVEALARSGIGELTLVDLDEICVTNTNRQLHTLISTIGQSKVHQMKLRCLEINPEIKVNLVEDFLVNDNYQSILSAAHFDFVCDAIDSLTHKCLIINYCFKAKLPLVTVGAAGGKKDPTQIQLSDLNKSFNDSLLYRVRKKLRRDFDFDRSKKPYGIDCVFSPEEIEQSVELCETTNGKGLDCGGGLGSSCVVTASMGLTAASTILAKLAKKNDL